MLSKDLMKMSMRDCTENVYVLPDQRKTNNWSTKKNKNEEEKEIQANERWEEERRIAIRYVYECIANRNSQDELFMFLEKYIITYQNDEH